MKKKLKNVLVICGLIVALSVLVSPLLSGNAQKSQSQEKPQSQDDASMQAVRSNVIANKLYETLLEKEAGWGLTKASPFTSGRDGQAISLRLKKGMTEARITVMEFTSEEEAKECLNINISQGIIKECGQGECGDEGLRIYNDDGKFGALMFRVGNVLVNVDCNSEELAKRFAGYVINSIANR